MELGFGWRRWGGMGCGVVRGVLNRGRRGSWGGRPGEGLRDLRRGNRFPLARWRRKGGEDGADKRAPLVSGVARGAG